MKEQWAVFLQKTINDEEEHSQVSVFEIEEDAYREVDRLNDDAIDRIEDFYYVRNLND